VQANFIQRKQFSETDATSHVFQQISDLKILPECFRGPLKTLWRATRGPVVGPHCYRQCCFNSVMLRFTIFCQHTIVIDIEMFYVNFKLQLNLIRISTIFTIRITDISVYLCFSQPVNNRQIFDNWFHEICVVS